MYKLLSSEHHLPFLDRLLSLRGVFDDHQEFLSPTLGKHRWDPLLLNDMNIGTDILIQAMKDRKSICIFWDYDVDGVTSSFLMYTLLCTYMRYPKVKIMYPDRLKDWYGMKVHHVDAIKAAGHDLIITVDNGITSIQEMIHAKNLGLQVIITDHHKALDIIPGADAIINPQISPWYEFKWLCGAWVVLKFTSALLKKSTFSEEKKQYIMSHFIPIVAIATVADCVPLLWENRALVKRGLAQMTRRSDMLPSLNGLLDFVNVSWPLKSFHIWFIIWPRINAWWRLATGYDSLKTLLFTGEKQIECLKSLDEINDRRKKLQAEALEIALEQINLDNNILMAMDKSFHEGIVGIVAGRITEKYNKPSIVLHISESKGIAVGSLRWPEYFDVMMMMQWVQQQSFWLWSQSDTGILIKFWWHKQAWGMSLHINDISLLEKLIKEYSTINIKNEQTKKVINVDTLIHAHEWTTEILSPLDHMEPFGKQNEEPLFVLQDTIIKSVEKVGTKWKWHLKISVNHGGKHIDSMYRSKWDLTENYTVGDTIDIVGKVKFDGYKQQYYVDGTLLTPLQDDILINEEEVE